MGKSSYKKCPICHQFVRKAHREEHYATHRQTEGTATATQRSRQRSTSEVLRQDVLNIVQAGYNTAWYNASFDAVDTMVQQRLSTEVTEERRHTVILTMQAMVRRVHHHMQRGSEEEALYRTESTVSTSSSSSSSSSSPSPERPQRQEAQSAPAVQPTEQTSAEANVEQQQNEALVEPELNLDEGHAFSAEESVRPAVEEQKLRPHGRTKTSKRTSTGTHKSRPAARTVVYREPVSATVTRPPDTQDVYVPAAATTETPRSSVPYLSLTW